MEIDGKMGLDRLIVVGFGESSPRLTEMGQFWLI